MFGSTILEVVIGLVFVYCLYSLLATTIEEIIASLLSLRGKKLEIAIWRMLADNKPRSTDKGALLAAFYNHPMIKYMNDGGHFNKRPSYISAHNFSKVLIDVLTDYRNRSGQWTPSAISTSLENLAAKKTPEVQRDGNPIPSTRSEVKSRETPDSTTIPAPQEETVLFLKSIFAEANNDIIKFRVLLEQWFNDMMDRTTGWYKRQAQWILFAVGFTLAASLNVNTFEIVKRLSTDKTTLGQVVQLATNFSKNHPAGVGVPSATQRADSTTFARMDSLALYADSLSRTEIRQTNQLLGLGWGSGVCYSGWQIPVAFVGWLVTALAISLGAPFWFDLLGKLVQLRETGPKPGDGVPNSGKTDEVPITQRKG